MTVTRPPNETEAHHNAKVQVMANRHAIAAARNALAVELPGVAVFLLETAVARAIADEQQVAS